MLLKVTCGEDATTGAISTFLRPSTESLQGNIKKKRKRCGKCEEIVVKHDTYKNQTSEESARTDDTTFLENDVLNLMSASAFRDQGLLVEEVELTSVHMVQPRKHLPVRLFSALIFPRKIKICKSRHMTEAFDGGEINLKPK